MMSPSSIEVHDLQSRINRKLNELQKRKIRAINASAKIKDNRKEFNQFRWNTIKRQIQQFQKQKKNVDKNSKPLKLTMKNEELFALVNRIMLLLKLIIKLSEDIANYRRLQVLCIFFHFSVTIVFNAYNLVVFILKMVNQPAAVGSISMDMLLSFYGYYITDSMIGIFVTVITYSGVFKSIRNTARKMDELNMYILDSAINARITQLSSYVFNNFRTFTIFGLYNVDGSLVTSIVSGTATYIIILIQYSGDGEICKPPVNFPINETYH